MITVGLDLHKRYITACPSTGQGRCSLSIDGSSRAWTR
jgi:hypothetical protein